MPAGIQLWWGQLAIYCWQLGRPKGALLQLAGHIECLCHREVWNCPLPGPFGFYCRSWLFCICEERVMVSLAWVALVLLTGRQCNSLYTGDKFCHGVSLHNAIASRSLKTVTFPVLGFFVVFLEHIFQMVIMLFTKIFHPKIIHYQKELNGSPFVFPKSRSSYCFIVIWLFKACAEEVIGKLSLLI